MTRQSAPTYARWCVASRRLRLRHCFWEAENRGLVKMRASNIHVKELPMSKINCDPELTLQLPSFLLRYIDGLTIVSANVPIRPVSDHHSAFILPLTPSVPHCPNMDQFGSPETVHRNNYFRRKDNACLLLQDKGDGC